MSNALDGKERNSFENEFNFSLEVIDFSYIYWKVILAPIK